mmetsp:Transcript_36975/g.89754  ORF Transcript_36975/g.89754 Transcript_36975/m.89754 type:complete len:230 (-) Transcript_36975:2909-3598(-)
MLFLEGSVQRMRSAIDNSACLPFSFDEEREVLSFGAAKGLDVALLSAASLERKSRIAHTSLTGISIGMPLDASSSSTDFARGPRLCNLVNRASTSSSLSSMLNPVLLSDESTPPLTSLSPSSVSSTLILNALLLISVIVPFPAENVFPPGVQIGSSTVKELCMAYPQQNGTMNGADAVEDGKTTAVKLGGILRPLVEEENFEVTDVLFDLDARPSTSSSPAPSAFSSWT